MVKLRIGKIILYYLGGLIKGPYKGKRMAGELEEEVNDRIRGQSDEISGSENRRKGTQTTCGIWKRRDMDFFVVSRRNTSLLTPSFYPSETHFGVLYLCNYIIKYTICK